MSPAAASGQWVLNSVAISLAVCWIAAGTCTSCAFAAGVRQVDANKVPQYKPGSHCANCLQLTGKEGDEWRPCNIFPGKLVNANGWCKVWVVKPGAKVG